MFGAIRSFKYIRNLRKTSEWSVTWENAQNQVNFSLKSKNLETKIGKYIFKNANLFHPKELGNLLFLMLKGLNSEQIAKILNKDISWVLKFKKEVEFPDISTDYSPSTRNKKQIEEKLKTISPGEEINVTMGTTPSGPITLANAYTLAVGIYDINNLCEKYKIIPQFSLGLNDNAIEISQEDLKYRRDLILLFLNDINETLGIEVPLLNFSDIQKETGFREMLGEYHQRNVLHYFLGHIEIKRKHKSERDFDFIIANKEHDIDFMDLDFDYSSNIKGLIALRAAYANSKIHILGGDQMHIGRMFADYRFPLSLPPQPYTPGIVYGINGEEMHASQGNAINYHEIRKSPKTIEEIIELSLTNSDQIGYLQYKHLFD